MRNFCVPLSWCWRARGLRFCRQRVGGPSDLRRYGSGATVSSIISSSPNVALFPPQWMKLSLIHENERR